MSKSMIRDIISDAVKATAAGKMCGQHQEGFYEKVANDRLKQHGYSERVTWCYGALIVEGDTLAEEEADRNYKWRQECPEWRKGCK